MWIVALALRRPYTFVVMALVIMLLMPLRQSCARRLIFSRTSIFRRHQRGLELHRYVARGHGEPDCHQL